MKRYSTATITALAEIITGGSMGTPGLPVGHYRSGSQLTQFFGHLNEQFNLNNGSRVPTTIQLLENINRSADGYGRITKIIEAALAPVDYLDDSKKLEAVIDYMEKRLAFDDLSLVRDERRVRVVAKNGLMPATTRLKESASKLSFGSVVEDFNRAEKHARTDPSAALTAACSTLESVCKCLLDEMQHPYPRKQNVSSLAREVANHLNLSPGRTDFPKEWENDIKTVLSGLVSVVGGIGALRTHAGSAHGSSKNRIGVDERIALLAINSACAIALFYIETWHKVQARKIANV